MLKAVWLTIDELLLPMDAAVNAAARELLAFPPVCCRNIGAIVEAAPQAAPSASGICWRT